MRTAHISTTVARARLIGQSFLSDLSALSYMPIQIQQLKKQKGSMTARGQDGGSISERIDQQESLINNIQLRFEPPFIILSFSLSLPLSHSLFLSLSLSLIFSLSLSLFLSLSLHLFLSLFVCLSLTLSTTGTTSLFSV